MGFVILFAPAAVALLAAFALSLKTLNPIAKIKPMQPSAEPATVPTHRQDTDKHAFARELTQV